MELLIAGFLLGVAVPKLIAWAKMPYYWECPECGVEFRASKKEGIELAKQQHHSGGS